MTKKKKDDEVMSDEKDLQPAEAPTIIVTEAVKPTEGVVDIFDFTVDRSAMGPTTEMAYLLLRRKAKLANNGHGDETLLPRGTMTRAEVEKLLGSTIEEAKIASKCCG